MDPERPPRSSGPRSPSGCRPTPRPAPPRLRAHGIVPTLALVSVGDDPASAVYLGPQDQRPARPRASRCAPSASRPRRALPAGRSRMLAELRAGSRSPRRPAPDAAACRLAGAGAPARHPARQGRRRLPPREPRAASRSGCPASSPARPLGIHALLAHYNVHARGAARRRRRAERDRGHAARAPALAEGRRRDGDARPLAHRRPAGRVPRGRRARRRARACRVRSAPRT